MRIGAFYLPYPVCFHPALPDFRSLDAVLLIPYPSGGHIAGAIPRTMPFIGCGDAKHIAGAFRSGAADYLCNPWTEEEFTARIGKIRQKTVLSFAGDKFVLKGTRLEGPNGFEPLSREEAAILRILYRESGKDLSRVALRRLLWPRSDDTSRAVDETISRLRRRLDAAGISKSYMEIRSVRGVGYRLEISQ